ncbi:bifunctional diaminohydroxyphosphoribosylaminopyrimidine deaminase/5-amino-6-(5-phosphoribosylamino)uracil reductase RibD [Flavilitoribacter nigricans]|uniref:Riboflavin biosynthesis protein RibD n=1 Tax=Flavilitoribacter nigricans (strain ATCC 23147 / DSM 23189 / NBRC 102662 / NCIMB 1420 / SS-2) TaxID=1122177 RepID=A0A2D0NL26_FLAN2|nr:bifunctional diaminohydroxyphosphoribosylaminopyrimidine deaminase/5-amino-6-(5-phosphoribosylamino)uracil reductase RibD [Flavilitoribacter nigricans]PHN08443.1 riboflavin biosynthesis protein RibD [Flavilitoribacter nigricans DSM 23189 = NBRC 102662]
MLVLAEKYMQRCFELARLGTGSTAPNPTVGAVIVYQDRIIGEGYHTRYGHPHAEVEAVRSVSAEDRHLIPRSTLYVSLEPCSVHGRTPPCTDLIIREKIPEVVISYIDRSPGVNGEGVARLREHGVEVVEGVLSEAGKLLSAPRNIFVTRQRPYLILKYAVSANGYLGLPDGKPFWLTNGYSKRLVHRWRSEVDAIMVGTSTALYDNPRLNTRLFPGSSPIRVIPDRNLRLPLHLHVFDDSIPTLIFTHQNPPDHEFTQTEYIQLEPEDFFGALLRELHRRNIQTLMVEGGQVILEHFQKTGLWDEARIFRTPHYLEEGLPAPTIGHAPYQVHRLLEDHLEIHYAPHLLRFL